ISTDLHVVCAVHPAWAVLRVELKCSGAGGIKARLQSRARASETIGRTELVARRGNPVNEAKNQSCTRARLCDRDLDVLHAVHNTSHKQVAGCGYGRSGEIPDVGVEIVHIYERSGAVARMSETLLEDRIEARVGLNRSYPLLPSAPD